MQYLASRKQNKNQMVGNNGSLQCHVAILMAAYNEQHCIAAKIESVFACGYPNNLITFYIGSDASTDDTDKIIQKYTKKFPQIVFKRFEQRTGKAGIINHLANLAQAPILVLTDADTIFESNLLSNLVAPFENSKVGGVQAHFEAFSHDAQSVSLQELAYNKFETNIKIGEGELGAVIGAFGTCYAVRRQLYKPVPKGFLVDDFYIFVQVLKQGYQTRYAANAVTSYSVSGSSDVQFKRKVRIGHGNFQNMFALKANAGPSFWANYAFYGHKIIRWLGPFLLLGSLISAYFIRNLHFVTQILWFLHVLVLVLFFVDRLLMRFNFQVKPLRFIGHFISMNLALGMGFIKFVFTSSDGTWGKAGN